MATGTIPIPEGATLQAMPAVPSVPASVPIPQGATLQPLDQGLPEPADFLQHAYETSPIKGIVETAKSQWDQARQKVEEDQAIGKQTIDLLKSGDYGRAAETLLVHLAKRGGQGLAGPSGAMIADTSQSSYEHGKKAVQAAGKGEVGETVAQTAEAVPVLGQLAEQIGEPLGKDVKEGNYGAAAGDVVGGAASIAPLLLGKGKAAPVEKAAAVEPAITQGVREVAGEAIPTVAKVKAPPEGTAAADLAKAKTETQAGLEKIYSKQTEPAAKGAVSKLVTEAVRKADTSAPELGTFEDAADYYKAQAKPTYEKLDELAKRDYKPAIPSKNTGLVDEAGKPIMSEAVPESGSKLTFSDMQRMERNAYRNLDFETVDKAKAMQQEVLTKYASHFEPGELEKADALWKRGTANQEIHEVLNSPSVVGDTPDELVANKNSPDPGMWKGKPLLRAIRKLNGVNEDLSDSVFKKAGMPQQSVANMQELGRVLTREGNMTRFNAIFKQLASTESVGKQIAGAMARKAVVGTAGAMAGSAIPVVGSSIGAGAAIAADQWLLPKIMGKITKNPQALKTMVTGMKSGASAAVVANALRPYLKESTVQ